MNVIGRIEKGEVKLLVMTNLPKGPNEAFPIHQELKDDYSELLRIAKLGAAAEKVRPKDEYHEDMGDVLWWKFPIDEPPYVGSPLDCNWPGYHTHFTPFHIPLLEVSHD